MGTRNKSSRANEVVVTAAALTIPSKVQRKASFKNGDRVTFKISRRSITITAVEAPVYKPTEAERRAIRKGEVEIHCGESASLTDLLHDLDRNRRPVRAKRTRKVSR